MSNEPEEIDAPDTPDDDRQAIEGEVVSETYDGPGEWVPIALAAVRLGKSERTLRRWQKLPTPPYKQRLIDGNTHVWMPLSGAAPDTSTATGGEPDMAAVAVPDKPDTMSVMVFKEWQAREAQRDQEIAELRARNLELERENAVLKERTLSWRERFKRWLG